jgi:hypothetical protein
MRDKALCPTSDRRATTVPCHCSCDVTVGFSTDTYSATIPVCLPPRLNQITGSAPQKDALQNMEVSVYNQEVFAYCSGTVASFLQAVIAAERSRFCSIPGTAIECSCDTVGAQDDTQACDRACDEMECTFSGRSPTCSGVLRQGNTLDLGACVCTRDDTCGSVPAVGDPPLCRP